MTEYFALMRLNKPIGIYLLLWPTLWALWLAGAGHPDRGIVLIFILGTIIMRSAGCIVNDFADRDFDCHVTRTRDRPLTTGKIKPKNALCLLALLLIAAFTLALFLNRLTILLAFIGAGLTLLYPFLKRITHLPQVGLGITFSWGVPMAFAAELNEVPVAAWTLFFTAALWPIIYDTIYALADRADDLKIGIKSTAILFGAYARLIIAILQSIFLVLLIYMGYLFNLTLWYFCSLLCVAGFFIYQQYLIQKYEPKKCLQAFLNNHWVGLSLFLGIVL